MAIVYSSEAIADLAQIWEWIAERSSIHAADILRTRIESTLQPTLAAHAGLGRARPEFGSGVRSFPIAPYVVFYQIAQNDVQILRVLHGHRDIHEPLMSLLAAI